MTIMDSLVIALAGGLGAVCRLIFAQWHGKLPWGILAANTVASLVAGFAAVGIQTNAVAATIVISGLCGGLSTFSSFSAQTVEYFKAKQVLRGVFNILLNFLAPAVAVLGGALIAFSLLK
jgi:CrcB protein